MEHFYYLKQSIFNVVEKLFFKQIEDDFYLHFEIWGSHFEMWKFPLPVSIFRHGIFQLLCFHFV